MNRFTLSQLRDLADSLSLLTGTFQTKPFYLRARQIRQADKALIFADSLFSKKLGQDAAQWKEASEGLVVLHKKLSLYDEKQAEIDGAQEKIDAFKRETRAWFELEETERHRMILNAKRAKHFTANQNDSAETHILHRYKRFLALKSLSPYSENATYLCDAMFHYENKDKYEANILKLQEKVSKLYEKLKNIKRGFWVAVILCSLIMTIPLAFPFAISLWRRKRDLESQILNHEETLKRENKRLIAADEGLGVSQEMKNVLGNVALDVIRQVLLEVKELRSEFLGPERTASSTALLLNFFDNNRTKIATVFGPIPERYTDAFSWFSHKINQYQNTETHIKQLEEQRIQLIAQQRQIMKGYSKEILLQSIQKLEDIVANLFDLPLEEENKSFFIDICKDVPQVLSQIREVLFYASRNHPVDMNYWNVLKMKIQSCSNTLGLCVLDAEISLQLQPGDSKVVPMQSSGNKTYLKLNAL